jgi:hypothetical protein
VGIEPGADGSDGRQHRWSLPEGGNGW